MPMDEQYPCILCHGTVTGQVHRRDRWRYVRCAACGLVWIVPRPSFSDLAAAYEEYLPVDGEEVAAWDRMMKPVIDSAIEVIVRRTGGGTGRVLDIGCGFGFFLREMKNRGWQVEGLEISPVGSRYTSDTLEIPVHLRPLEALELADNVFDVVTLFYVIEHVLDPLSLLAEVNRVLAPGGLVLLRWPHSTPIVRLLGPLSGLLDLYHTPYHLYDFSPATINALLRQTGFHRLETVIGGATKPPQVAQRIVSLCFGGMAQGLCRLSHGTVLLPGVSKTTTAFA